jgi:hypothetical protein
VITASVTPLIPRDLVGGLAQSVFGAMRTKGDVPTGEVRAWTSDGSSWAWKKVITQSGRKEGGERHNAYMP